MNKKAIGALFAVLAIVVVCGCGQSTPPPASKSADKASQVPVTPVTVVDAKKGAEPAPAVPAPAPAWSETKPAIEEPKEEPLPEVLAKVGDDTITAKDFERKLGLAKKMSMAGGAMGSPTIEQKRQLLQNMIREKTVLALAKNQGITVTEEEVQKEVENAKSKLPPEQFQKRMADQGITEEELPNLVRQSLVTRKFAESKTKDLQATDEELAAEFERMKSAGKADRKDETTDVAHILIKVEEGADEAAWNAAKEKIDAARTRITGGQKFEDVAKEVSEDPGSKEKGGLYTDVPKGRMVPEFDEKIASTPVGQVSEPFKTKYGWHILTVVAKHAPGPMTLDDVKSSLSERIIRTKRSQVMMTLMQEAEAGVKTEILYAPFAASATPPMPPMHPPMPPMHPPMPGAAPAPSSATPPPAPEASPAPVAPPAAPPAPPAPDGGEKK